MTTQTIIETGDLVRILRGSLKGTQFTVQFCNVDNTVLDSDNNSHKRGNLAIVQKGTPEVEEVEDDPNGYDGEGDVQIAPGFWVPEDSLISDETLPYCECGCGQQVLRKNRIFRQGHDQRRRGQLLRELGITKDETKVDSLISKLQRHWDYSYSELMNRSGMKGEDE